MSTKIRCVVIEDEPQNRKLLCKRLREFENIEIVGEDDSVEDGYDLIKAVKPDAVFLDIEIIGGNAFQILEKLKADKLPIPYVVITTAHLNYAVDAINEYSQYVVKYIQKPYLGTDSIPKFKDAIASIETVLNNPKAANVATALGQNDFIFIRTIEGYTRIDFQAIKYIETLGEGRIAIVTDKATPPIDMSLIKLRDTLPGYIKQVSKSHAVNIHLIEDINRGDQTVKIKGHNKPIGIGDKYYGELLELLGVK